MLVAINVYSEKNRAWKELIRIMYNTHIYKTSMIMPITLYAKLKN